MPHPLDEIAPTLARWLAPYVADELRDMAPPAAPTLSPDYDEETCAFYLLELGERVVERAEVLFGALAEKRGRGEPGIDSLELVDLLDRLERENGRPGVGSPRQVPALLTNSLKRRAKALGLPRPWTEDTTGANRTLWSDRDGIASRMVSAISDEGLRRLGHPADEHGGARALEDRQRLAGEEV